MTTKLTIDPATGAAEVVQDNGLNADGSKALTSWGIPAAQLDKHIGMFNQPDARRLTPGDISAMRDAAAQFGKK